MILKPTLVCKKMIENKYYWISFVVVKKIMKNFYGKQINANLTKFFFPFFESGVNLYLFRIDDNDKDDKDK